MLKLLFARCLSACHSKASSSKTFTAYCLCGVQDITGIIPADIPTIPGKPTPTPRRRVGTSFVLSPKLFSPETEVG